MTCPACNVEYNDPTLCDCPTEPECDHVWTFVADWEGDPRIPNGTHDLSHFECEHCGETRDPYDAELRAFQADAKAEAWLEREGDR